jgi:hypothetical protein
MKKKLTREKSELFSRRLAQASDAEIVKRRILQIDFELQKMDLDRGEE